MNRNHGSEFVRFSNRTSKHKSTDNQKRNSQLMCFGLRVFLRDVEVHNPRKPKQAAHRGSTHRERRDEDAGAEGRRAEADARHARALDHAHLRRGGAGGGRGARREAAVEAGLCTVACARWPVHGWRAVATRVLRASRLRTATRRLMG